MMMQRAADTGLTRARLLIVPKQYVHWADEPMFVCRIDAETGRLAQEARPPEEGGIVEMHDLSVDQLAR